MPIRTFMPIYHSSSAMLKGRPFRHRTEQLRPPSGRSSEEDVQERIQENVQEEPANSLLDLESADSLEEPHLTTDYHLGPKL